MHISIASLAGIVPGHSGTMMEDHMAAGNHARVVAAIKELADYAHEHGLGAVHQSLFHALGAVQAFSHDENSEWDHEEEATWFSSVLDMLIAFCRRHGWEEVLDHLLEARMAWDEREDDQPVGNIIAFRKGKS
ncbi:hypothetical protein LHP98_05690 [Rhodobacter sp. Har01]|uniref:hypothetical protein n=1 Tax=Rhodobacter sp. Har01 TaxID=2883999 RepID=UPI001D06B849|nr:hypothetical protein [Rhodobacter sp. Har01]MCB6177620.1 hypothetical protein [Rhodobacter sp. Har01]